MTTSLRTRFALCLVASAILAPACADDDGDTNPTDTGTDTTDAGDASGDTTPDADPDAGVDADPDTAPDAVLDTAPDAEPDTTPGECSDAGATDTLLVADDYFLSISVAPLGGLLINFRVEIAADDDELLVARIFSLSPDLTWESPEPIATACNVAVEDGSFRIAIDNVTIPPQGTTTGVQVLVTDFALDGTLLDNTSFCGDAEGFVPLLGFNIETSTFGAVPFGDQTNPPLSSCEPPEVITYDPIETCPSLVSGVNELVSAELDREFQLFVPSELPEGPLPIVFLFHGLGDSGEGVLGYTGFADLVDDGGFVLVVPEGANTSTGGQVFPVDWNTLAAQYDTDNQDLVFFDDMLKCVGEQFTLDADRVYVTGMSGGGLMTTFLGLHRSDIVAAVAPMSGGYLQAWPDALANVRPWLVGWGGEDDIAVGTNFDDAANNLIANLVDDEVPVIACNHGEEHTWPLAMTPAIWEFLSSFVRGDDTNPFAEALPEVFPDYCVIVD